MQVPSCTNVRIRSTADVHKIFYAVYLGLLPMITRRLDAKEREALSSGYCYAWEDRGPHAITGIGIERFTEGRHWSASRVRDEFLFYYEKWEPPKNKYDDRAADGQPPRDWDPYVKQTYSVYLNASEGNKRKWHLTAYFTQATVDNLGTVDDIPVLKDLVVPEGLFKSSRRTKTRSSRASAAANATDTAPAVSTPASSSGKGGKQVASVAGPSSSVNCPPQVTPQPAPPQQNQALPQSPYPHDLFTAESPTYSGLPTNSAPPPPPAAQHHDAYTRMYTGGSYAAPQPPEGYRVTPPHMLPPVSPFGYNWHEPPTPVSDNSCQSPYSYPLFVAPQNGDSTFHHSPTQSQVYLYGSGFQMPPQSLLQYRPVSPALSHAPSQFSVSSQSQSSSESDSPAPGPVSLRTPVFSPERLSVVLPTDGDHKYETVPLHGIREHDGAFDSVTLASMESLKRFHPYRRDPLDDRVVQRLSRPV
ncbi:hypothetical protein F5148DRAFT_111128 [Russula earlei]|uniref:Uncharacterized protein n=1 Tax=Russula earlei TaxID=71964 RepID=A0ACC0U6Z6_9AGAM|nr:hypothetical protein F5148DRAFT_111128 [Russula earlei]